MDQQSIRGSRRSCRLVISSFSTSINGDIDTVDGRVNLPLFEIQPVDGGI